MVKWFTIKFHSCPVHERGDPGCTAAQYTVKSSTGEKRGVLCAREFERTTGVRFNGCKRFKLVEVKTPRKRG